MDHQLTKPMVRGSIWASMDLELELPTASRFVCRRILQPEAIIGLPSLVGSRVAELRTRLFFNLQYFGRPHLHITLHSSNQFQSHKSGCEAAIQTLMNN